MKIYFTEWEWKKNLLILALGKRLMNTNYGSESSGGQQIHTQTHTNTHTDADDDEVKFILAPF